MLSVQQTLHESTSELYIILCAKVEKALRESKIKLDKLKEQVMQSSEMCSSLAARTDAPSRHWSILQAVLLFMKTPPDQCDSWEKAQQYVASESFSAAFTSCDVTVVRDLLMVQSAESVKAMLEGTDIKNVERTHVPIAMLMEWLQQALVVHAAAVEVRKAEKEAADAAGTPFETPVEDNITDKPVDEPEPSAE